MVTKAFLIQFFIFSFIFIVCFNGIAICCLLDSDSHEAIVTSILAILVDAIFINAWYQFYKDYKSEIRHANWNAIREYTEYKWIQK